MNTLKDISSEIIRQNWTNYKDEMYDSPYYDMLWDSLEKKINIDKTDTYFCILKKFINNEEINYKKPLFDRIHINQIDNKTLECKGLDNEERKYIHLLCDKIGLHHQSKTHPKKKNKRILYIYKPNIWLWEYTEKNPYSKSDEYYKKIELEKQKRLQELNEQLSRTYCYMCCQNGLETDLFHSVYIRGTYCNDCLEISDDEGYKLSDHKFEPI
jgi:hypothetical protein